MKGRTLNNLDIKISGLDTKMIYLFEQTGLTPLEDSSYAYSPILDEWFYIIDGDYLFQVGKERFK
ncbi:MAG: hypothetical protein IPP89_15855 [Saprospiraceae bacterium]|nr:hypothetical protein [Candidatus Brachybacter algidus]MBL0120407.1 hypothetical protein [Candidatus Brachybacter algidus]